MSLTRPLADNARLELPTGDRVIARGDGEFDVLVAVQEVVDVVLAAQQGPAGPAGPPGPVGPKGDSTKTFVSADPDNRLTTGSDDGLFVPEIVIDPLAYYILAKA